MMKLFIKEQATGKQIRASQDVYETCRNMAQADQEIMLLIGYNNKNREIFREVAFKGGLSGAFVDLKTLFRHLLLKNCSAFVLVHNHPTEDPRPSKEDKELTLNVKEAAKVIDLRFLDHIIIGGEEYFSFADEGELVN